jgi:hypothetical protein
MKFGEVLGMLLAGPANEILDEPLSDLADMTSSWWYATRSSGARDSSLPLHLTNAGTFGDAADLLVDPFGDFLAASLTEPLSPAGAARLTVASHLGGLVIHLWRHWQSGYEMGCAGELAGHIPGELILCAVGQCKMVPASALRGYVPEKPAFSIHAAQPIRIGWDTGHHVAFVCAERGWFGDARASS